MTAPHRGAGPDQARQPFELRGASARDVTAQAVRWLSPRFRGNAADLSRARGAAASTAILADLALP